MEDMNRAYSRHIVTEAAPVYIGERRGREREALRKDDRKSSLGGRPLTPDVY